MLYLLINLRNVHFPRSKQEMQVFQVLRIPFYIRNFCKVKGFNRIVEQCLHEFVYRNYLNITH